MNDIDPTAPPAADWTVRVYREKFVERVPAADWSEDAVANFLAAVVRDNGPGTLAELIAPDGAVVASEVAS